MVADALRRQGRLACPRCKDTLREVTRVLPLQNEDGLIAYECPACSYVTSVIRPAKKRQTDDPLTTFNKYRAHIESSASAKYDRQDFEPEDGRTILVTIRDLGSLGACTET